MAEPPGRQEGNVALAFGMVCAAGACTSLGAAMAFCVNLESKRFLAVSLALSCGVMFYVSMIEIFVKSLTAFSDMFCPERLVGDVCPRAYGATTGFFFLGLAITAVLNMITSTQSLEFICRKFGCSCNSALPVTSRHVAERASEDSQRAGKTEEESGPTPEQQPQPTPEAVGLEQQPQPTPEPQPQPTPEPQPLPPGWEVKVTRGSMRPYFVHTQSGEYSWSFPGLQGTGHCACDSHEIEMILPPPPRIEGAEMPLGSDLKRNHPAVEDRAKLNATGLLTGLAIAIHNFPEGLATFVAAMAEPSLGAAIAVAIAIHNVPEGVCVAMPIFYSTGSRLRAFMWATLSGVSEPIGALFGYLVLGGEVSQMAYGSMFGIVAGMMVYISLAELLPSAYRFESNPAVVTGALISGMVIMALSLIAFQI